MLAQCGSLAFDLDSFSKHGKRSVVSVEDVKLCVRKNQPSKNQPSKNQAMVAYLADFAATLKKTKK
ncbi:hypothetical protein BJ741DRAFT_608611 [Chytriomyces cf. hyalinus JEL632]|nr:hypothetical protein BJ741DRAFT_608611 [Chytriomyces cf. hyalinus JEL632]